MKTFLAIVLCFCVGCGVSEQEKLAKRINDKMDREEERAKKNEPSAELIRLQEQEWEKAKANMKKIDPEFGLEFIKRFEQKDKNN